MGLLCNVQARRLVVRRQERVRVFLVDDERVDGLLVRLRVKSTAMAYQRLDGHDVAQVDVHGDAIASVLLVNRQRALRLTRYAQKDVVQHAETDVVGGREEVLLLRMSSDKGANRPLDILLFEGDEVVVVVTNGCLVGREKRND